jgi:hypothetical protein
MTGGAGLHTTGALQVSFGGGFFVGGGAGEHAIGNAMEMILIKLQSSFSSSANATGGLPSIVFRLSAIGKEIVSFRLTRWRSRCWLFPPASIVGPLRPCRWCDDGPELFGRLLLRVRRGWTTLAANGRQKHDRG